MSENNFHSSKRQDSAKRLADNLRRRNSASESGITEDEEMLSLIIEEACQGIDISQRYPAFYRKLLQNPDLRQAFLDILELIEDEEQNVRIPWTEEAEVDLGFLTERSSQPIIARLENRWRISLQRTIDYLRSVFSLSALEYRADPISEDPWFMLLQEEFEVEDILYTVVVECTFSEENEEAFSPYLNVAVTIGTVKKHSPFPIQASLQWGAYKETIQISEEGRTKFPDIPLKVIFGSEHKSVIAEMDLVLETSM